MRTVLLPVKDFHDAKQRLAGALDPELRAGLAQAMLVDVLSALAAARSPERIIVFTASDRIMRIADSFNFEVILETSVDGHSAAVNSAVRRLRFGAGRILAIASDLPALSGADVDRLFDTASSAVTLVPSRDGTGTNAVLFESPAMIEMEYGGNSLARHLRKSEALGLSVEVLRIPGIEFDVDTPQDLRAFIESSPADSNTWRYITANHLARTVSV